jgi:hypothetical protein
MSTADVSTYKPSVFYFRKALHEALAREDAVAIAMTVHAEFARLQRWTREREIIDERISEHGIAMFERAIRASTALGQPVLLGLFLCHELEQLKAIVRDHGLIPPKWFVTAEEAGEKGWVG